VAVHRAVHQSAENGAIFSDPFARAILGSDADKAIAERSLPEHAPMRMFVAARSRFAQDSLDTAVARGVRQVVVLGAGLDTTALRNPDMPVFEVDHPETQAWKRERLAQMAISSPPSLHFVPVDFERESLADRLALARFDPSRPAFFVWLGVVPYLSRDAILQTLMFVAGVPDSEIIFDYGEPLQNLQPQDQEHARAFSARVAAIGEPFRSFFDPAELHALLRRAGFGEIEDVGIRQIGLRYLGQDWPEKTGAHILRAHRASV
jgi:methyltransferase (TIGR00027 family)